MKNQIINLFLGLLIVFTVFSLWYKEKHSMGVIYPYEINSRENNLLVLVATQESIYKDHLTCNLIEQIKHDDMYLRVIDITGLMHEDETNYDAIFIIHTWEIWRAPSVIHTFLDAVKDKSRIYAIGTSGGGDLSLKGVDGISAASEIHNTDYIVSKAVQWLNQKNFVRNDQTSIF